MLDARKRTIPAGGDPSVSRVTIFEAFGLSINDVVPVVNATERAQVVTDLNAKSQGPTSSRPLIVSRADARGLHRIEYSYDGTAWLPASGVLTFSSLADATSWATSNASLLTTGDICMAGGKRFEWRGQWMPVDSGDVALTLASGWSNVASMDAASVRMVNGMVSLNGRVNGSGTKDAFTLPTWARPGVDRVASVMIGGNTLQTVIIATSGLVTFYDLSGTVSDYRLASIAPFPAGA